MQKEAPTIPNESVIRLNQLVTSQGRKKAGETVQYYVARSFETDQHSRHATAS